jgi:hypothetical protein
MGFVYSGIFIIIPACDVIRVDRIIRPDIMIDEARFFILTALLLFGYNYITSYWILK